MVASVPLNRLIRSVTPGRRVGQAVGQTVGRALGRNETVGLNVGDDEGVYVPIN